MKYTINKLHAELGRLIKQGHGRRIVHVDKDTFRHNLEPDGCTVLAVAGLGIVWVPTMDDDGGTKWNKDGTESGRTMLVLAGDAGANSKGELVK